MTDEYDEYVDYEPDDDTLAELAWEGWVRKAKKDGSRARRATTASRGRPVLEIRCPDGHRAGEVRRTVHYGLVVINTGKPEEPAFPLDSAADIDAHATRHDARGPIKLDVTCRCGTRQVSVDEIKRHRASGKGRVLLLAE